MTTYGVDLGDSTAEWIASASTELARAGDSRGAAVSLLKILFGLRVRKHGEGS